MEEYKRKHDAEALNTFDARPWLDMKTASERNLEQEVDKFLAEYEGMSKYKRLSEEEKLINSLRDDGGAVNTQARR